MPRRMRRSRPRRARLARRSKRRSNRFSGSKGALKKYTYKFRIDDQFILANSGGTAQQVSSAGGGPIVPAGPATPSGTPPPGTNWMVFANPIYSANNIVSLGGAVVFRASDAINFTPFQNIYDSYRITKIVCNVEYMNNTSTVNGLGLMPTLYYSVDQDGLYSASYPNIASDITDRQGSKKMTFSSSRPRHRIVIKPKLAVNVYKVGDAPNVAYTQSQGNPWVDCQGGVGADYYGLLFWIDNFLANGTALNAFRFQWEYHLEFKGAFNLH